MVHPAPKSLHLCTAFLMAFLLLLGSLLSSCDRDKAADATPKANPLQAELETATRKLSVAELSLATKNDELTLANEAAETVKKQLAEKDLVLTQNDELIRALQSELAALKKREAFVFAEISVLQQQGQSIIATSRYQQFIKDFPKSPLAANAASAIAEMAVKDQREARQRAEVLDPKRQEREILKNFTDGFVTLQELAPVLKKKSLSQVLTMLGTPNQTYNDGTEIGYVDKAINPATGRRGMLIISFASGAVSTLRVEYAGRPMTP
ncbi:MAG: hypothetical protein QOE70_5552 [Chthoniobacter sp.]|jgi:hypothetical protein|nr:hypothetical protein [Chthoniobacter sp.]